MKSAKRLGYQQSGLEECTKNLRKFIKLLHLNIRTGDVPVCAERLRELCRVHERMPT